MALSERELLSHLSVLKDSELLYERGIYPQSTYIFKHALIQDATYQSLLKSRRQKYHRKIAQVLEKHFPETAETHPELLAHHFTEAGLNEQAVGYWHQAGKRATQHSAHVEAINHLTKGLEVLMTLPDTLERARQELDVQITLGPVLMAVKGNCVFGHGTGLRPGPGTLSAGGRNPAALSGAARAVEVLYGPGGVADGA